MDKTIFVFLATLAASQASHAQWGQAPQGMISSADGSVSTMEQNKVLVKALFSIKSNDPRINAVELNKKLQELGLPTIDADSPNLKFTEARTNSTFGSTLIGVEINDGKNRFCLPCQTGWNAFEAGITKVLTPEELFAKNKALVAEFFGSCQYIESETAILEMKRKSCDTLPQSLCRMEANCMKLVNGRRELTKVSATCLAPNGRCPNNPLDCFATRSLVTVTYGKSAIGDDHFPGRADAPANLPKKVVE